MTYEHGYRRGYEYGVDAGRAFERTRAHKHAWGKLFVYIVAGSFVGCALALLLAFWLTSL